MLNKKFITVFLANLSNALFLWLVISMLAKNYGLDLVGYYTLSLSIITPIFTFVYFGFRNLITSDIEEKLNLNRLFFYKNILFLIFLIFSILGYIFFYRDIPLSVFLYVLIFKSIDTFFDFFSGIMYLRDRVFINGILIILKNFLFILALFVGIFVIDSYIFSFMAINLLYLFFVLFVKKYNNINLELKINNKEIKFVLRNSSYIVFSAFVGALVVNMPNYYLGWLYGSDLVGNYAIFYSIYTILSIFVISLCQLFLKNIALYNKKNDIKLIKNTFIKSSLAILMACCVSSLLFYFFHNSLIEFLFGSEALDYSGWIYIFLLLCIPIYIGQVLSYICIGVGKNYILSISSLFNLAISSFSCYLLVKNYGLFGALVNNLFVGIVQCIIFYYYLCLKKR